MKFFVATFFTLMAIAAAQDLDKCLREDSISCVQKSLYRSAKSFFDMDTLEIVTGVNLVKSKDGSRSARTSERVALDQEIEGSKDIVGIQSNLENFIGEEAGNFISERSLKINFAPMIEKVAKSARALAETVPEEMRSDVSDVFQGRGKKTKLLKFLAPALTFIKLKLAALSYFVIALVAKKAIIVSLISIAISAWLGMRNIFAAKGGAETTAYNNGWAAAPTYGAPQYSAPVAPASSWDDSAHNQAYSGYHR